MDNPFFDPEESIHVSQGDILPHWHQEGKIQFITFRLADSLPQSRIQEIKVLSATFEKHNPKPWDKSTTLRYKNLIGNTQSKILDNGYGECILKDKAIRSIITQSLHFFDTKRFYIIAYVIMPNHIHLLIRLYTGFKLEQIIHSIKSYSALQINRYRNTNGPVWMSRYYDTIVRNEDHLKHYINYIINNPRHLPSTSYTLYVR